MYMLCTTLQLLEQFLLLLLPHQQPPRPPERPRPPEQSPPLLPLDQDAVELLPGPDGAGVHVPLHLVGGRTDQVTCCKSLHPGQHGLIAKLHPCPAQLLSAALKLARDHRLGGRSKLNLHQRCAVACGGHWRNRPGSPPALWQRLHCR